MSGVSFPFFFRCVLIHVKCTDTVWVGSQWGEVTTSVGGVSSFNLIEILAVSFERSSTNHHRWVQELERWILFCLCWLVLGDYSVPGTYSQIDRQILIR